LEAHYSSEEASLIPPSPAVGTWQEKLHEKERGMSTIRRRCWVSNGATKSAWVVDYRDNGGTRRQKTFSRKKSAEKFLTSVSWELSEGTHVPDKETVTVKEAFQMWIKRCELKKLEQSTTENYSYVGKKHILPYIGEIKLTKLTKVRVEQFCDELLEDHPPKRAARALLYLKMAISEAQRLGKIAKNVAQEVKLEESDRHEETVTVLSKRELNDFLDAADKIPGRTRALAYLLIHGLRASEIRGLPWRNVDLEHGTVYIGQRADRWCKIGPTKTKHSKRTIDLTPDAQMALADWEKESSGQELVFQTSSGRPLCYEDVITCIFDPLMRAAGLTKNVDGEIKHRYALHAFRHTTASIWIEHGFSPKRVQTLMGHSSIQVTFDLYGHLIELRHSRPELMRQLEDDLRRGGRRQHKADIDFMPATFLSANSASSMGGLLSFVLT
jgi:integrase